MLSEQAYVTIRVRGDINGENYLTWPDLLTPSRAIIRVS
jgi:hypothetical protein